jgi:hypothetical protein
VRDFEDFVRRFGAALGLSDAQNLELPADEQGFYRVAKALSVLNEFLYVTTPELQNGDMSEFHRFWRSYHSSILGIRIDEAKCRSVAQRLEELFAAYGQTLRPQLPEDISLSPELIANCRFFTAVQDFSIRLRPIEPYLIAARLPRLFDASEVLGSDSTIDSLLRELGAESQYDKRRKFARLCAQLLIERYDGQAVNIARVHDNDAISIRNALTQNPDERFSSQLGFSDKKANMLIRDMHELGVWSNLRNLEELDVSSDANTMRIALRLGIVRTRIPLLTSYLDVYCYQYAAIDGAARSAWREVWRQWGSIPSNHRVAAPAFFDFLVYRTGQICCRPGSRACEQPVGGSRLVALRELILGSNGYCPFRGLEEEGTKMLNSPRSISIYGRTGWSRGATNLGGGGGISS